ncbi:MAG: hypothetical protein WC523_00925 [Patescibacteria group bacterium]|jgi:hypothetical protein
MDKFEKKYGIEEDEAIKDFHRSRRMFCIINNILYIAEPNLPYSHAIWFEKEGWMTESNDSLMSEATRGVVDDKGDIYFYIGYDFGLDEKTKTIFFSHLKELVNRLNLNLDSQIFGGLIKSDSSTKWPPIKDFGKIKNNL